MLGTNQRYLDAMVASCASVMKNSTLLQRVFDARARVLVAVLFDPHNRDNLGRGWLRLWRKSQL